MNARQAILKAADFIERNPSRFNFGSVCFPRQHDCGTPGCALGWIGVFAELPQMHEPGHWSVLRASREVLGLSDRTHNGAVFYERMNALDDCPFPNTWRDCAADCARVLRLYADKYHPAESHAPIPASVRDIFTMSDAQLREALNA